MSQQPEPTFDPNLPSGSTYVFQPKRSMKYRIEAILKDHQHELLDADNLDEAQAARERIASAIIDELP